MTRKILSIPEGEVFSLGFLKGLLDISKYYDNKGIDFLSHFDTFCGNNSGAIIATAFVFREKILERGLKKDPNFYKYCGTTNKDKVIKHLSSNIIRYLMGVLSANLDILFGRSGVILEGIFGKSSEIINVLKEYFNFTMDDIYNGRTLIIKVINKSWNNDVKIFTNTNSLQYLPESFNGNKISTYLPEILNSSITAGSIVSQINEEIFSSNCLLEIILLFRDDPQKIVSIKTNKNKSLLEGIFSKVRSVFSFGGNSRIINNFHKIFNGNNIFEWEFNFGNNTTTTEIINSAKNNENNELINFINKNIIYEKIITKKIVKRSKSARI